MKSAANAEPADQFAIALVVLALDVVEQAAAIADHFQQPAARMIIVLMGLKMLSQIDDPLE